MATAKRKLLVIVILCIVIISTSVTLFAFYSSNSKAITIGKIIDIKDLGSFRVGGRLHEITYVYSVNGKDVAQKQRLGVRYPKQALGNRVKVEYNLKNPLESEAVGFYMDFKNSNNRVEFHAAKEFGYHSIELINDLYYYINYADSGKVIQKIAGQYRIEKDTLIVTPFNHEIENKYRTVKYVLVQNPTVNSRFGIKNVSNHRVFE